MSSSETPIKCSSGTELSVSRLRSSGSHFKRIREQASDGLCDVIDDTRPKTRRVNPERLATRLDPRLVAEMEALIVPGAKMPNFTIRKDFQERYCVDRRHIYDYFHSRGLRVAKEDKHNNLLKGRLSKARSQTAMTTGGDNSLSVAKQATAKRSLEMSGKTRGTQLNGGPKKGKLHIVTNSSESYTTLSALGSSPPSLNTPPDSAEQSSSNASPEPGVTSTNEVIDKISDPELETVNSSLDSLYSFYGLYQTCDVPSSVFGLQGFSSLEADDTSFVQEELLGYFDFGSKNIFTQDGTFQEDLSLGLHDKASNYHAKTRDAEAHRYPELKHGSLKLQTPESMGSVEKEEGDVDFSKWLLVLETQDDKTGSLATKAVRT